MFKILAAIALAPIASSAAFAQTCAGAPITGIVRDITGALIPGASLSLDDSKTLTSGPDGRFRFPCVTSGPHTLTATFADFAAVTLKLTAPRAGDLVFKLVPSSQVSITVDAEQDDMQTAPPGGGNAIVISGKRLQSLADDPDDLLRQLQQLSAASGGSPGRATISVDGFQDDAKLPPKDSIAFINVSPDLFSAEYREPPFGGGRVEVYTKPGAKNFHGSLFTTNSSSWMNASDPFTTATGSLGKQRYGFDLSGPIRKQGSNFSLNLEHRSIDETVAVNAITLDGNGNPAPSLDTVPIPQRLWNGNARVDWQLGPKNIAFVTFSANTTTLQNLGVGGQTLRAAGYSSSQTDYTIRSSNVTTVSDRLVHEIRASYEQYNEDELPNSTGPSLQVSGYFTGGGASIGASLQHRKRVEFGDDFILNTRNHLIKAGVQLIYVHRNSDVLTNFNGTYIFSGVTSGTSYTSPLQQYQQAQVGGSATEFNNVAGNPTVHLSQVRFAVFYQDNVKLSEKWSAFYGLRYAFETDPAAFNGIAPRSGFGYTPDKKKTWQLKSHFGVFNDQYGADDAQELHREDGVQRITSLVYNPVFGHPFQGATPIQARRTLAPGLNLPTNVIGDFTVSKDLPFGFNINAQSVFIRILTNAYTVNINQPLGPDPTPSPYGPRPITPNQNILETRSNGSGQGHGEFLGLSNFRMKHVQFFLGGLHLNIRDNSDNSTFFQPQSAYTNAGEITRRSGQSLWQTFGNVTVSLPYKIAFSSNGYGNGGTPFNITTGADNNGDGNFNDRPQYAPAGSVANDTTVFRTPLGLLTNAGAIINGIPVAPIQRNLGALPWNFHLDANLQRNFKLTRDPKAAHQQTVAINVRSANFLNHTNVTAEGSTLGSPQFLIPIAADTARRIEFGLRYSF